MANIEMWTNHLKVKGAFLQKVTFCTKAKVSFTAEDLSKKHHVKVASVPLCNECQHLSEITGFLKLRGIYKLLILSRFTISPRILPKESNEK